MARSMIYFYPTSDVPVTTRNVIKAVRVCSAPPLRLDGMEDMASTHEDERRKRFEVTAFLSVPYILSTLAEEPEGEGMELLKEMELVSTGGAPLETAIGDAMVRKGIRLVSRLGSSECGCKPLVIISVIGTIGSVLITPSPTQLSSRLHGRKGLGAAAER
jgi:hypothetical protein